MGTHATPQSWTQSWLSSSTSRTRRRRTRRMWAPNSLLWTTLLWTSRLWVDRMILSLGAALRLLFGIVRSICTRRWIFVSEAATVALDRPANTFPSQILQQVTEEFDEEEEDEAITVSWLNHRVIYFKVIIYRCMIILNSNPKQIYANATTRCLILWWRRASATHVIAQNYSHMVAWRRRGCRSDGVSHAGNSWGWYRGGYDGNQCWLRRKNTYVDRL